MKTPIKIGYFLFLAAFIAACQPNNQKTASPKNDPFQVEPADSAPPISQTDVVFYNLFSPVDAYKVIDPKSIYFNSAIINPINNHSNYTDSYKIALNLGVYGADLSYLWAFNQSQQAITYLAAIKQMTDKLGIPTDFVDFTVSSAASSSSELDSLIDIARDAYKATDRYLKGSERDNTASMILLGGWVETLYIALNLYNTPNPALASKILSQKYSLNSLILVIHNYQDDIKMSEYLILLKKLNDSFKKIESKLKPENIEIDTVNKVISIKESANLQIKPEEFKEIFDQILKIRAHITE